MTSLSITELTYRDAVDYSEGGVVAFAYGVARMRATFTFLMHDGEEAQGSVAIG